MMEAIAQIPDIELDEVGEDHFTPRHRAKWLRGIHRGLRVFYRAELSREIRDALVAFRPDILLVYKGSSVLSNDIEFAKKMGIRAVNIFPDYSPLVYGDGLRRALGVYDLVISTKVFHPAIWNTTYGYLNRCVFIPHGYDPSVHEFPFFPSSFDFDIVMVANARPQYELILQAIAGAFPYRSVKVGVSGPGWHGLRSRFPSHWTFAGAVHGRAYSMWLRRGAIVIAPVNSDVVIAGQRQHGDEDTTRTYELAAANCFFLHYRTPFVKELYDEVAEVPMWSDFEELNALIGKYLVEPESRRVMAMAAHARAVPAYSIPARAAEVVNYLRRL